MTTKDRNTRKPPSAAETDLARIEAGTIPSARVREWNQSVANLFHELSADRRLRILADGLSALIPCDHWYVIYFHKDEPPVMALHSNIYDTSSRYSDGPYILDPFYNAFTDGITAGCYRLKDFAKADYSKLGEYRDFLAETGGPVDEIGLICPLDEQTAAHVCLYRRAGVSDFRPEHIEAMLVTAPIVETVMRGAWVEKYAPAETDRPNRADYHETIRRFYREFGNSVLTAREAEVARFLIKGYSAPEIGDLLGVSSGTVRNHMKKIYRKLKVSTQAELCALFIEDLVNLAAA